MTFPFMPLVSGSAPGNVWSTVASGTTRTLKNIATDGAGTFVIASSFLTANTLVFRSTDNGATWAPVTVTAAPLNLWGCVYLPGIGFCVTQDSGAISYKSATGATWAVTGFAAGQAYRNATANDGWAAFGADNGASYYSQDLTTSDAGPLIGTNSAVAALYVADLNRTLAVGGVGQGKYFNGDPSGFGSWTGAITGQTQSMRSVAWGNGIGVMVGDAGVIQSSANLIAWTLRHTDASARGFLEVEWCADRFIAVGVSGVAVQSFDGRIWEATTIATAQDLWGVTCGGGAIIVTGASGLILRSTN